MKITAHRPDLSQKYTNPFRDKRVHPFDKIGRVVVEKTTGDILLWLGETDSRLTLEGAPWTYNESLHDIMVHFPAFYYKREWEGELLKDYIITEVPINPVSSDGKYNIFPVFLREDGTVRPYVLVGAFKGVELGGQLRSVIGYKPTVNKTISAFRDLARQGRDSRWNIETFGIISMVQFLYKIAFQDLDSQKILGNGWTNKTASAITGSTLGLGNRCGFLDPFENSPDKPLDSISMSFQCVDGELVFYNKKDSDPMPIKTMNNNGLQVLEEVPGEYKIYIDKDAVFTTVQKYAPGSYQTFMERKADVDNNRSLLRGYNIEWTQKDDSDLFIQCNNEAISKIENQPMTLDEPTQPVVLEPKTVPTTYECCFRVGNDGVYVGEGHENLYSKISSFATSSTLEVLGDKEKCSFVATWKGEDKIDSFNIWSLNPNNLGAVAGSVFSIRYDCDKISKINIFRVHAYRDASGNYLTYDSSVKDNSSSITFPANYESDGSLNLRYNNVQLYNGYTETVYNICLTKTSTPKPFVKSVMPSGKLAFVTNATSETHSFVMKGIGEQSHKQYSVFFSTKKDVPFTKVNAENSSLLFSSYFSKVLPQNVAPNSGSVYTDYLNLVSLQSSQRNNDSFTQFLIYKANLTETELKAENSKFIKATDNQNTSLEYPANGNQISLFGIEDFFGNIWSFADGFFVKDDGYYITNEPNKMGILSEHTHYPATPLMGTNSNEYVEGYFKTIEKGASVYNIPNLLGSSGTKNYTDCFWSHRRSQTNICLFGARWPDGVLAGAFCLDLHPSASVSGSTVGARLVFCP